MSHALNPAQQEAVEYINGPLLVLAGAGSGKTRVITHKIIHLIKNCSIPAKNIAAVTFTNKAAREMKSRVGQLLKGREGYGLKVSTFHHLGLQLLRKECHHLGYKPGFSIFDSQDSQSLLKELYKNDIGQLDEQIAPFQYKISHWKNTQVSPEQALSHAFDEFEQQAALLFQSYQKHLKAYNAIDFDDLIVLPTTLFLEKPDILEKWQHQIRYFLIDEYQDTNTIQYQFISLLVKFREAFTVVGDDDQSIYAWRGAQPENLNLLSDDFPRLKVIKLEQNYRSTQRILKSANQLISHNPHLFEKKLWSQLNYGDPIRILECNNEEDEARRVVSEILHCRFSDNVKNADIALLYRGNHQARVFEKALREHQVPYHVHGGQSFFERSEIKDIMSYLKLIANPDDDTALLRVINTPRREIGPSTLEKIGHFSTEHKVSLLGACKHPHINSVLNKRASLQIQGFADLINELQIKSRQQTAFKLTRELIQSIEYEGWLKETCNTLKAAETKISYVNDLVKWLENIAEKTDHESLAETTAYLTLMDIIERQSEAENDDQVTLMTLHSSKGLEFPTVFLVGMEEQLLPHRASIEEETIDEERRLAYVGITRAQKQLIVTLAKRRKRQGEIVECEPSRFLNELPQEDLQWEKKQKADVKKSKEKGNAYLANLKEMLK